MAGVDARLGDFRFPAHSHDHVCIGVMLEGEKSSRYGLRRHTVGKGDVILVNPGEVHDGQPSGRCDRVYRMLEIETEAFTRLCRDALGRDGMQFERPVIHAPRLHTAVIRWIATLTGGDALAERDAAAEFLGAMSSLGGGPRTSAAARDLAARAGARMRADAEAGAGGGDALHDLAVELGASRYQLIRAFKQAHGLTPEDFRRQLRVQRARALLGGPDRLVDIASDAGFTDQSHMTREFRRLVGLTPAAYRAAFRQG